MWFFCDANAAYEQGLAVVRFRVGLKRDHVPNHPELHRLFEARGEVFEDGLADLAQRMSPVGRQARPGNLSTVWAVLCNGLSPP